MTRIAVADARVAIVEDDAAVRRALSRVLGAARFYVTAFGSAEEFLVSGLEPPPDCVLLDVHLPVMNGLELQSHMAVMRPNICVVFLTADHELAGAERRESRCVWLTKPVDEDALIDAIVHACGGKDAMARLHPH
jgi:FixJ family two-component response regulator